MMQVNISGLNPEELSKGFQYDPGQSDRSTPCRAKMGKPFFHKAGVKPKSGK